MFAGANPFLKEDASAIREIQFRDDVSIVSNPHHDDVNTPKKQTIHEDVVVVRTKQLPRWDIVSGRPVHDSWNEKQRLLVIQMRTRVEVWLEKAYNKAQAALTQCSLKLLDHRDMLAAKRKEVADLKDKVTKAHRDMSLMSESFDAAVKHAMAATHGKLSAKLSQAQSQLNALETETHGLEVCAGSKGIEHVWDSTWRSLLSQVDKYEQAVTALSQKVRVAPDPKALGFSETDLPQPGDPEFAWKLKESPILAEAGIERMVLPEKGAKTSCNRGTQEPGDPSPQGSFVERTLFVNKLLAPYQRMVQLVMHPDAKGRGAVAVHDVGSGKTCSGLAAIMTWFNIINFPDLARRYLGHRWGENRKTTVNVLVLTPSQRLMTMWRKDLFACHPANLDPRPVEAGGNVEYRNWDSTPSPQTPPEIILHSKLPELRNVKVRIRVKRMDVVFHNEFQKHWDMVIVDEAHNLVNDRLLRERRGDAAAQNTRTIRNFIVEAMHTPFSPFSRHRPKVGKVLLLTATPVIDEDRQLDILRLFELIVDRTQNTQAVKYLNEFLRGGAQAKAETRFVESLRTEEGSKRFMETFSGLVSKISLSLDPTMFPQLASTALKCDACGESRGRCAWRVTQDDPATLQPVMSVRPDADFVRWQRQAVARNDFSSFIPFEIQCELSHEARRRRRAAQKAHKPRGDGWFSLKSYRVERRAVSRSKKYVSAGRTTHVVPSTKVMAVYHRVTKTQMSKFVFYFPHSHKSLVSNVHQTGIVDVLASQPDVEFVGIQDLPKISPSASKVQRDAVLSAWFNKRQSLFPTLKMRFMFLGSTATDRDLSPDEMQCMLDLYNHPRNREGQYINLILLNRQVMEGVSIKAASTLIISEPTESDSELRQVVGRVFRRCAFDQRPEVNPWRITVIVLTSYILDNKPSSSRPANSLAKPKQGSGKRSRLSEGHVVGESSGPALIYGFEHSLVGPQDEHQPAFSALTTAPSKDMLEDARRMHEKLQRVVGPTARLMELLGTMAVDCVLFRDYNSSKDGGRWKCLRDKSFVDRDANKNATLTALEGDDVRPACYLLDAVDDGVRAREHANLISKSMSELSEMVTGLDEGDGIVNQLTHGNFVKHKMDKFEWFKRAQRDVRKTAELARAHNEDWRVEEDDGALATARRNCFVVGGLMFPFNGLPRKGRFYTIEDETLRQHLFRLNVEPNLHPKLFMRLLRDTRESVVSRAFTSVKNTIAGAVSGVVAGAIDVGKKGLASLWDDGSPAKAEEQQQAKEDAEIAAGLAEHAGLPDEQDFDDARLVKELRQIMLAILEARRRTFVSDTTGANLAVVASWEPRVDATLARMDAAEHMLAADLAILDTLGSQIVLDKN